MRRSATERGARTLALIMAGSEHGTLTGLANGCALPFGASHRVLDFPVGNCVASGVRRIALLTHGESHTLVAYVQQCAAALAPAAGEFIEVWPARRCQCRSSFSPAVDVLVQNLELIAERAPEQVLLLRGSQICRADYRPMLEAHAAGKSGVTIGCVEMPVADARHCDVVALDSLGRVLSVDQPYRPAHARGRSAAALVSMGVYVFDRELLRDCLEVDAADECSSHDLTRDLLPLLIRASGVQAHVFRAPATGAPYWRDVDSVDGYWRANMDLLRDGPKADLSSAPFAARTARFVVGGGSSAVRSIVAGGCTIAGNVRDSVLSTDCEVRSGAVVESSIVLPGARIGRGCRVRRAIIGAGCVLPDDTVIGENARRDAERFDVSPGGVVVVTANRAERAARPGLH